jgi:hypothetical protein
MKIIYTRLRKSFLLVLMSLLVWGLSAKADPNPKQLLEMIQVQQKATKVLEGGLN